MKIRLDIFRVGSRGDIADLDRVAADTTRADIRQAYANLMNGSENHKSAFLRQLGR